MKKLLAVMTLATMVTGCATGIQGEKIVGRPGSPMWFSTASVPTQIATLNRYVLLMGSMIAH